MSAAARGVLRRAVAAFGDHPETADSLRRQLDRLDGPLRVAIAGKVKAGKSTLLNALVGEDIAATDAGECTKVVTWYRDGQTPKVVAHPLAGAPRSLPVHRRDGALTIDLGGSRPEELDRLVVDWPSQSLRSATFIDTPGIASVSTGIARRTLAFLTPDDESVTDADAVIYLMRHLHSADAQFLESFRDQAVARAGLVNTIAVLSRADEVGGGRVDGMLSAKTIARRYSADPTLRGLCQTVVPVAGLLAFTGRTLRADEFAALAQLARSPREDVDAMLLSADLFLAAGSAGFAVSAGHELLPRAVREYLVGRFGLFGIRLSVTLLRQGTDTPEGLAAELVRRSGLADLREVLLTLFMRRRDLLKVRSALLAVERALNAHPEVEAAELTRDVERIMSGAHELTELSLISALRTDEINLPQGQRIEAEQLLGGDGVAPAARLGLPKDTGRENLRLAATETLERWQRRAENPLASRAAAGVCRAVARSCEGILAGMPNA